jgi:hypothetical protein
MTVGVLRDSCVSFFIENRLVVVSVDQLSETTNRYLS